MAISRAGREKLRRRLMNGLAAVAQELVNQAKLRAVRHVDTGELRNSIAYAREHNSVLFGLPRNVKNISLELGFKPHWVPAQYIGVWARRHDIHAYRRNRRGRLVRRAVTGVYVGGPGSHLDYGPGGAAAVRVFGRRRVFQRWKTRGERSPYIAPGKVGFSVIRWTVANKLRSIAIPAFIRGYRNAR